MVAGFFVLADEVSIKKTMKSPIIYECDGTKEHFTTTQIDDIKFSQVYNLYRVKYGVPFPDEIKNKEKEYQSLIKYKFKESLYGYISVRWNRFYSLINDMI
jgi:hypothetical protein